MSIAAPIPSAEIQGSSSDGPFPLSDWQAKLPKLAPIYQNAQPVPHIYLEGLIDPAAAHELEAEFPQPSSDAWTHYQHQNENKHGMTKREKFPPRLGAACDALNSPEFCAWLSELTGIPGLMADPTLEGGGLHQSGRGGYLNVHTDFSHHHYHKNWKRRINLILYLNSGWQPGWGGDIELWDAKMQRCVAKYPPLINNAFLFNTNEVSYHGFPEALQCPEGSSRKSLAFYYYTSEQGSVTATRSTNYRARPTDSAGKSMLIWLDKKAVDLYSRAKKTFGFSDDFASRILGTFFGKKK